MGLPVWKPLLEADDPRRAIVDMPQGFLGDVTAASYEDDPLDEFAALFAAKFMDTPVEKNGWWKGLQVRPNRPPTQRTW